ncbi:MAG: hypothetical protein ACTHQM_16925 [Thermoanaerobaculia bacterium]
MKKFAVITLFVALVSCEQRSAAPPPVVSQETAPTSTAPASTSTHEDVRVTTPDEIVKQFGARMKQVSLTADRPIVREAMQRAYGDLVAPRLLETWSNAPQSAPGRLTSSPWPDRIESIHSTIAGDTANATGVLVEATSTGDARRVPVTIRLARHDDSWRITEYRAAEPEIDRADDAIAALREYYDAINRKDFRAAFARWGTSGPPNQTFAQFEKGFEATRNVELTIGDASRIEGAAGSRYIDVPVTIVATTSSGTKQRFTGTYTLRRSVVDGASDADHKWHLYRASLRESR